MSGTMALRTLSVFAGLAALLLGLAGILVWIGESGPVGIGIMQIAGDDFFRWVWGGSVVACGGLLLIAGGLRGAGLEGRARAFLGAVLVGLVAGCDIFGMICTSIPAGAESSAFFNSAAGFIGGFAPPYTPAVLLLPFMAAIAFFLFREEAA
jgi:hypothetical protein